MIAWKSDGFKPSGAANLFLILSNGRRQAIRVRGSPSITTKDIDYILLFQASPSLDPSTLFFSFESFRPPLAYLRML